MLRLLLIRHGVTEWNLSGRLMGRIELGLAEEGRTQVGALAGALANLSIDDIVSSPQQRTQETAALIAEPRGLAVRTEPDLDEVWLGPRWQGRTFEEIRDDPDLRAWRRDATFVCDAIEPIAQVQERVVGAVERLRPNGEDRTVALVSHGDPLRVLLAHYLHVPLADYRRLTVETASVSVVTRGRTHDRVLLMSWRPGNALERAVPAAAFATARS